jgi:hypothetical protein
MTTPSASSKVTLLAAEPVEQHHAIRGILFATLLGALFWTTALAAWNLR